ncbi:hypothetical protein Zmor_016644 [Zophobas morio]|uniref:Uncharacterized protein n=1 Tax=Zophobas morio TaxID=2755281 RepID=A0AA38I839_9CUCU|nr:hypothetical protein Zmor_016644 [Zophobas morio]
MLIQTDSKAPSFEPKEIALIKTKSRAVKVRHVRHLPAEKRQLPHPPSDSSSGLPSEARQVPERSRSEINYARLPHARTSPAACVCMYPATLFLRNVKCSVCCLIVPS